MRIVYQLPILLVMLSAVAASAQISEGGHPPSFLPQNAAFFDIVSAPPMKTLPALDVANAFQQDMKQPEQGRFAAPLPVADIGLATDGRWTELPNGDRVWRCALESPKAKGLLLMFDQFRLPPGSRFYAYPPDKEQVFGGYSERSCTPSGKFLIGVLPGDQAILEYFEPRAVKGQGQVHLNRIDYVYDPAGLVPGDTPEDFGQSLGCNINVNCTQGQNWQMEKKGVARILMVFSNGAGWCTGTLIANTGSTGDPYFLTAHHCQLIGQTPDFSMWRFDFDYEAPTCANPGAEPTPKSVLGCQRISYRAETDFMLLKTSPIPLAYNLYFNGWNRTPATNALVTSSTFIHHPSGDIKKISVDHDPAVLHDQAVNWGGVFGTSAAYSHWKVVPDEGIYQPGSSGCPLFDQNKRIVGQLHGGNADQNNPCLILNAYFGRFDYSWIQGSTPDTRLKEWLDPGNTLALTQNGYVQPPASKITISGNIKTHWGVNMANVQVNLSGGATLSTRTDASGNYSFPNLESGLSYTVTPERDTNDVNGVTTFDLSLINKHVLGLNPLDSPWKILAADANSSNSVSTSDIVEGRKVILGLNTAFPGVSSWRFFPATINFSDPANPFSGFPGGPPPQYLQFTALQENVTDANFKGVKMGDVNNNADSNG